MCTLTLQIIIPFEWVYGSLFRACEGQDPTFALEMWQGTWMSCGNCPWLRSLKAKTLLLPWRCGKVHRCLVVIVLG